MRLLDKLSSPPSLFSLEFFPPKKDMPISTVYESISRLAEYEPSFVSVTYGAGGSNRSRTIEIASYVQNTLGLEAIAHLTCVGATPELVHSMLDELKEKRIGNILALRGDIPEGMNPGDAYRHYRHTSDLISEIREKNGFTIAAAAYPEMHVESADSAEDIRHMKLKAETGADFFITQLCFDRRALVDFYEQVYKAGIHAPVITGIMPVLNPKQIIHMALLSACSIPAGLSRIICKYGENAEDFSKAGIEYAIEEICFLKRSGIHLFHLYTMNKVEAVALILKGSGLA